MRGSVEREGDSGATWLLLLLLSSPLKLFLHTGHVSCCVATEQKGHMALALGSEGERIYMCLEEDSGRDYFGSDSSAGFPHGLMLNEGGQQGSANRSTDGFSLRMQQIQASCGRKPISQGF